MSSRDLATRIVRAAQADVGLQLRTGVVKTINAGTPRTVTVTVGGSDADARYLAVYAPTVGDVVKIIQDGPDLLVLGDLA
jgi:hypothetical protein